MKTSEMWVVIVDSVVAVVRGVVATTQHAQQLAHQRRGFSRASALVVFVVAFAVATTTIVGVCL